MNKHKIGDILKSARKSVSLTQKEVAEKVGITQSRYSNYENGYSQPPVDLFKQLADILEIYSEEYIDDWGNYYNDKEFKDEFVKGYNYDIEQLMFSNQLYDFRNFIDKIHDLVLRRRIANDFSLYLDTIAKFVTQIGNYCSKKVEFEKVKKHFLKKLNKINEDLIDAIAEVIDKDEFYF